MNGRDSSLPLSFPGESGIPSPFIKGGREVREEFVPGKSHFGKFREIRERKNRKKGQKMKKIPTLKTGKMKFGNDFGKFREKGRGLFVRFM